jgi:RNA polymerase primary sigma factor
MNSASEAKDIRDLAYLTGRDRPLLTRDDEVALGRRIEGGERALLEALLGAEAGRRELRAIADDLAGARVALEDVVRNVEHGRTAAQRRELLAALRAGSIEALVEQRLHPSVLERLEAATSDPRALVSAARARREIREAKRVLVESNLRLVMSFANRHKTKRLPFADLVQEGNLGLMRAVEKFDYRRGYRLSTYASWWIKQAIDRAVVDKAPTIRVPVHLVESRSQVVRARGELLRRGGEEPTAAEIADKSGLPLAKVELILGLAREPLSLDAPIREDNEGSISELVANDTSPMPDEEVERARLRASARELVRALPERERMVLTMRFGLGGAPERTLEDIGRELSLTRERIRQIEAAALALLRERCDERAFRPE